MKCKVCGTKTFIHYGTADKPLCRKCLSEDENRQSKRDQVDSSIADKNYPTEKRKKIDNSIRNKNKKTTLPVLGFLGFLFIILGFYFLIISPGHSVNGGNVINLQKLNIGQTCAIISAIFIAAEWRPR